MIHYKSRVARPGSRQINHLSRGGISMPPPHTLHDRLRKVNKQILYIYNNLGYGNAASSDRGGGKFINSLRRAKGRGNT